MNQMCVSVCADLLVGLWMEPLQFLLPLFSQQQVVRHIQGIRYTLSFIQDQITM